MAAGCRTALAKEWGVDEAVNREWMQEFILTLAGDGATKGFEHRTIRKGTAAWRRWCAYLHNKDGDADPFQAASVRWASFFRSVAKGGPTAAQGVFTSLEWLRRYTQITIPLESASVAKFRSAAPGHVPTPQRPLHLLAFGHLVKLLINDRPMWVNIAAALVVRVTMSALRLAHVERASCLPGECNARMLTWVISRGKGADRAGYKVSTPGSRLRIWTSSESWRKS